MIKIKYGNTRIAVILFWWLVMKFPNPRFDWISMNFKGKTSISIVKAVLKVPRLLYEAAVYGITANISEVLLYIVNRKANYLCPVFSIGICNFQKYQGENIPSDEEVQAIYKALPPDSIELFKRGDMHAQAPWNWRKTSKGLVLIDYALDPLRTSWAQYLRVYRKELIQATSKK